MAITRVAHGTVSKVASGNLSPGAPAGSASGDAWLCYAWSNDTTVMTMDAAWTAQFNASVPTGRRFQCFSFPYAGSTPVLTVTNGGAAGATAFIVGYRPTAGSTLSVDGTPATQAAAAGDTLTFPTLTPAQANEMCVFAWAVAADGLNGAVSGTDPTPTEQLDDPDAANFTSIGYADGIRAAATATGARTSTFSAVSGDRCGSTLLLKETAASQIIRPIADVAAGGWTTQAGAATGLAATLDEVATDDADYIQSTTNPNAEIVKLTMGNPGTPDAGTWTLSVRHKKQP